MRMKSIIATVAAMFLSLSLSAQTAEEIIDRMNVQLSRADAEGFAMDFNVKMPIIGKICSHNLIRGDKVRMELAMKSNKVKDDPKKMNLTVAKGTYLPICLEQKGFLMTVSMENVTIGVTEAQVTFNADEFPGVTITDNR